MIQFPWAALPLIAGLLALGAWVMRLMFRAELAEFRISLLDELNGKYMNSKMAEERLDRLGNEVQTTRHNLRNEIQIALGVIEFRQARER